MPNVKEVYSLRYDMDHTNAHFDLLSAFARALNHQVRTPLSTISNELFCVAADLPRSEITAAIEQTKRISKILGVAGQLGTSPIAHEKIDVREVVRIVFPQAVLPTTSCELIGDAARLELGLRLLPQLPQLKTESDSTVSVLFNENGCRLLFSHALTETIEDSTTTSLTEFYRTVFDSDSLIPILADCVFFAHNGIISVRGSTVLAVTIDLH